MAKNDLANLEKISNNNTSNRSSSQSPVKVSTTQTISTPNVKHLSYYQNQARLSLAGVSAEIILRRQTRK